MAVYPNSTLQSTSHPTGQIPAAGEEAIGMTVRVPTLALVSSVPLTDGVIFVDVGWSAPQGENPGQCISGCFKTDEAPISGWAANYPTPGNTVNMALQTGPQSNLNGHNNIELSALTATTFEIEVSFLATRDNDGFLPAEDDSGNLLTLSPNGLLTESSINSIAEFSTAAPSIYSRDGRIFYVDVAHRDFTTGAINRLTFEMPLRARHWSKNVDGVRYADTEGMTVTLDLNKKPATVLSTVGVTTVTWRLRTPIAIPATYWAGIFKVNEADQGGDAVTNLGLNLALSPGLQAVPGIPFSAISGMTPPVSLAPQYYEGAFDLNGAELERGKTYRPYIVFEDGIGNRYPEIGPAIRSGQQAPPIAGNVTQLLMTYDASDKQWTADSLNRVAPLERVRIVVTMDKSSYNADAFLNNAGGYFNNNFESLRFYLSTEPPVTVSEALALSSEAPTDQLTDAPTSLDRKSVV